MKEQRDALAGAKEDKSESKVPLTDACPAVAVQPSDPEQGETKEEAQSDGESLALRFKMYEASQKYVAHVLSFWDRGQGILLSPLIPEEVRTPAQEQRQRSSSRQNRRNKEKERLEKLKALEELEGEGAEGSSRRQDVGVPCLDIQVLSSEDVTRKIMESGKLPAAEQVKPCEARVCQASLVGALVQCVPAGDTDTEPCPGHW